MVVVDRCGALKQRNQGYPRARARINRQTRSAPIRGRDRRARTSDRLYRSCRVRRSVGASMNAEREEAEALRVEGLKKPEKARGQSRLERVESPGGPAASISASVRPATQQRSTKTLIQRKQSWRAESSLSSWFGQMAFGICGRPGQSWRDLRLRVRVHRLRLETTL